MGSPYLLASAVSLGFMDSEVLKERNRMSDCKICFGTISGKEHTPTCYVGLLESERDSLREEVQRLTEGRDWWQKVAEQWKDNGERAEKQAGGLAAALREIFVLGRFDDSQCAKAALAKHAAQQQGEGLSDEAKVDMKKFWKGDSR